LVAHGRLPIVQDMDSIKTSLPAASPVPSLPWRDLIGRIVTRLRALGRNDEQRFLDAATDLGDFERRQRLLERHGLPPADWPTR